MSDPMARNLFAVVLLLHAMRVADPGARVWPELRPGGAIAINEQVRGRVR
jgi:hypothetical protein